MASLVFDATQVEPSTEFEPIPAGKYVAVMVDSELKATKAGTGKFLELVFQVIEGEFKGRKVWSRLNLENPSQVAVKIARAELSSLCRAVSVLQPKDSCELHNLPLVLTVKQETGPDGEVRNVVRGYAKRENGNGVAPPQAKTATAPWRR